MEALKSDTIDDEPTQPIDIPAPAPTDMQLMLKHMADMEERLKPKPKVKRKASEKQIAALERARASRAITTLERNKLKKELKQKNKIVEKKFVNEGLAKLKSDDNTDVQDSANVSIDVKPVDVPVVAQQVRANIPPAYPIPDKSGVKSLKDFNFR
tara:strand:+ start:1294 stop:1758 length:465 start_codon:yes stop_codon:yes gene_type:complete